MNTEEELRNAENLFIKGNICEAIPLLQQLANQGVGRLIYLYSICQDYGYLDDGKLHWLDELLKAKASLRKKSIEAGEILSKLSTFDMFDDNVLSLQGIWNQMNALDVRAEERKQVYEAAEKLAKHGDVIAMWALGVSQMYPAEDTRWMKQAAEEGFGWLLNGWEMCISLGQKVLESIQITRRQHNIMKKPMKHFTFISISLNFLKKSNQTDMQR